MVVHFNPCQILKKRSCLKSFSALFFILTESINFTQRKLSNIYTLVLLFDIIYFEQSNEMCISYRDVEHLLKTKTECFYCKCL